jgi:DNA-binding MarR family transcriptional regulator
MSETRRQTGIHSFSDAMIALRAFERASKAGVPEASCVTPAQGMVVHEVACAGGTTTRAMARRLGISSSAVTQLVNALEIDGIVRRVADPFDGRKARIELTEYGVELYGRFDRARLAQAASTLEPLEDDEVLELARLLEKITGTRP